MHIQRMNVAYIDLRARVGLWERERLHSDTLTRKWTLIEARGH